MISTLFIASTAFSTTDAIVGDCANKEFDQCGGSGFSGSCCQTFDACNVINKFYSQCQPKDLCMVPQFGQCDGTDHSGKPWDPKKKCCPPSFHCKFKTQYYSQCEPDAPTPGKCMNAYEQCGGKDKAGKTWGPASDPKEKTCCIPGYHCAVKDPVYYSGCEPDPICTNPRFGQCGGQDAAGKPWTKDNGHDNCCPEGFKCVFESQYYSQCKANVAIYGVWCNMENIGHCLHDQLQHYWMYTRSHSEVAYWITPHEDRNTWQDHVMRLGAQSLGVHLLFGNASQTSSTVGNQTSVFPIQLATGMSAQDILPHPVQRHLLRLNFLHELRSIAWRYAGVGRSSEQNGTRSLYTRGDSTRGRRILEWEPYRTYFDRIFTTMQMPFFEQVRAFAEARVFVTTCGAATTNVMFMSGKATMIDIQIHVQNSWQTKFGDSKVIQTYLTPLASTYRSCNITAGIAALATAARAEAAAYTNASNCRTGKGDKLGTPFYHDVVLDSDLWRKIQPHLR